MRALLKLSSSQSVRLVRGTSFWGFRSNVPIEWSMGGYEVERSGGGLIGSYILWSVKLVRDGPKFGVGIFLL